MQRHRQPVVSRCETSCFTLTRMVRLMGKVVFTAVYCDLTIRGGIKIVDLENITDVM